MKHAMTDHKAEWVLVPRVATEAMRRAIYMALHYDMSVQNPDEWGAVDKAYAAMIAAAPAASEGEDGAVATLLASDPYDETCSKGPWMDMSDWERLRALPPGTKLYTRPAAQVAATPKHDEGRIAVCSNMGDSEANFIADGERLNCPACGGSGHIDDALATQPAARRVTDEELLGAIGRGWCSPENAGKECDVHLAVAILAEIRKLESFAQPAEGVSK